MMQPNVIETHEQVGELLFSLAFCFSTQPLDLCVFGDPPGLRVLLAIAVIGSDEAFAIKIEKLRDDADDAC
jgi:hypothetical protein